MTNQTSPSAYIYTRDKENPGCYFAINKGDAPDEYISFDDSQNSGFWGRYKISRQVGREHGFGKLKDAKKELELRAIISN